MKLTVNTETGDLIIRAKVITNKNFNSLVKEAFELLIQKYTRDQYDLPTEKSNETRIT